MTRAILAFLLLCSVAVADGPLFSIWHVTGHQYQWQADQIAAGLPLEPSIKLPTLSEANKAKTVTSQLDAHAAVLQTFSGGPIAIKFDNITTEIDRTFPRFAVNESNWRESVVCVRRKADGTLDQTPIADPFGPVEKWRDCGRQFAESQWMKQAQVHIPTVTRVIFRENNEGARRRFKLLGTEQGQWLPCSTLQAISLRDAEWVEPRRGRPMAECADEWFAEENARYQAFYEGFDAALTPGWRGKMQTVGYGRADENYQNDAQSPALYLGGSAGEVLTDPFYRTQLSNDFSRWEWAEWSVSLKGSVVAAGVVQGRTAAVDPESFAGYMTHSAWRMQGKPVRLTFFAKHTTVPTQLIVTEPEDITACQSIGRPDLLTLTVQDYEIALLRQMARIHDHPVLSRYWNEGTTVVLPSTSQVYATETTVPGEARKLLCVYTPCDLTGEIQVGEWSVPAKRLGYWLTPLGLEEIE